MLELGAGSTTPTDLIKDVDEATFMTEVIEKSQTTPVIVDFWAEWCGPCKTLGPALEAEVTAAGGKVVMAKVDVDRNQAIAGQLRIQSIPTVYAFWQGQPVDGFQGAIAPSEIKDFVAKIAALGGEDGGLSDALTAAEEMLSEGAASDAAETFAAILGEEPENAAAYSGLVRAYIAIGSVEQAEATLNGAPASISDSPEMENAAAQLELAKQASDAGPIGELKSQVEAAPDNHQHRFDLATALYANGEAEEAVNELLELFRRDRDWNDGAAKTQLFTIFDALNPDDQIALDGRRKLSSMIFA